ncbi:MAG: serine/threonine protein kinase [Planctomycetota bacterium]|nr:serine/threonine protein kinase [Planctomycetota bacterium]
MSATARNLLSEALMDETVHHESPRHDRPGPEGIEPMPKTPDKATQQRYTFSSGARPLDGFTIRRAIGRGGFGEVYYATSDAGKEVALKLITRNLEVERRGVVQCMNLKSPHLVAIHDLKQNDAGDTFVVMEFVAGPSLAQILAQHAAGLPAQEIRMWLKGLVEGVAYLHDHGIVHRDLKPANLFLEEGVVKIGDYGLTKAITAASRDPGHSECVGTCHYMAPETSTGKYHKPIDVYAIGVILYEMVTGRVPFDGESVGEVLMKHLTSRPDLTILPEPFKGIVGRALAKDPNHRPQRVTDLLLPGDAPKEPDLRFIGEKNSAGSPPMKDAPNRREEILRITDEEPVFYIGPETRPPARPRPRNFNQWLWARNPVSRAVQTRRASLRPAASPAPQPVATLASRPVQTAPRPAPAAAVPPVPRPAPAPAPVPLGPPPTLPSARVRVAELAGSMLWAAPIAGLASALTVPLVALAEDALPTDPRLMAVVFGVTLLTTWTALIAGKVWEGKTPARRIRRRGLQLLLGLVVGGAGLCLAEAIHVGPTSTPTQLNIDPSTFDFAPSSSRTLLAGAAEYASYFGLVLAAAPWWSYTVRDRKRRFRILPVVWVGLVGGLLGLMFPATAPAGVISVVLAAVVTQFVSPWNKESAEYARAARRQAA